MQYRMARSSNSSAAGGGGALILRKYHWTAMSSECIYEIMCKSYNIRGCITDWRALRTPQLLLAVEALWFWENINEQLVQVSLFINLSVYFTHRRTVTLAWGSDPQIFWKLKLLTIAFCCIQHRKSEVGENIFPHNFSQNLHIIKYKFFKIFFNFW